MTIQEWLRKTGQNPSSREAWERAYQQLVQEMDKEAALMYDPTPPKEIQSPKLREAAKEMTKPTKDQALKQFSEAWRNFVFSVYESIMRVFKK